jgi:hypothetical protein
MRARVTVLFRIQNPYHHRGEPDFFPERFESAKLHIGGIIVVEEGSGRDPEKRTKGR